MKTDQCERGLNTQADLQKNCRFLHIDFTVVLAKSCVLFHRQKLRNILQMKAFNAKEGSHFLVIYKFCIFVNIFS